MVETIPDKSLAREEALPHHEDQSGIQLPDPKTDVVNAPQQAKGPAVRFASTLQEIVPSHSLETGESATSDDIRQPLSPEAEAELKQLTLSITNPELQHRRMSNFAFEPVSLPASRVPSTDSSRPGTGTPRRSIALGSAVNTPPLTPETSSGKDTQQIKDVPRPPSSHITPQTSDPQNITIEQKRPSSASLASSRNGVTFSLGSTNSREESPISTPGPASGTVTPPTQYSRPSMPSGDKDDPYARSRRRPQSKNLDAIDANFIFGASKASNRHSMFVGSFQQAARDNSSLEVSGQDRRPSANPSIKNIKEEQKSHGSMSDLKRFFRFGHGKRSKSPAPNSIKSSRSSIAVEKPAVKAKHSPAPSQVQLPFADDHGLESKWGKFGKVLGSGAGGSVRLMKRSSDGTTFAVKQFRDRHPHESEREYNKKVTAEFCVGSTLHHGNIIETLDIIHENNHWYEVMEYAPYDLFAIVMTGRMSREEITCCFLQIFAGVTYLHGMGLAHRDLKLDNVVVNEHGIMKIIDFGSATVFRYPFETDIVLASGIVGSDPYLAPEVYDGAKYDPQPTDIWSLAIIFACMTLRRFPWKVPRVTDNSFRLFVLPPDPGTPGDLATRRTSETRPKSMMESSYGGNSHANTQNSEKSIDDGASKSSHHHHHHSSHSKSEVENSRPVSVAKTESSSKSEIIKGPWRLLRLLPRESRSIIGRMLELDPKKRATIDEMLQDPWVSNSPVCQQLDHGEIIRAEGHTHVLEPGSAEQPASKK